MTVKPARAPQRVLTVIASCAFVTMTVIVMAAD
jgi:hypothetical protein